jgi:hypothetical protein
MLSWSPPTKSRSDMSTDELIEGSTKDKDAGNELFKANDFSGNLCSYVYYADNERENYLVVHAR